MKAKLIVLSQVAALVFVALLSRECRADMFQQALTEPVSFVYTRPDAPGIQISIHSLDPSQGGPSDAQLQQMVAMLNLLPAKDLSGIPYIAFVPQASLVLNGAEKSGGTAPGKGIVVSSGDNGMSFFGSDPSWLQNLCHEIGHQVEYHLPNSQQQQWINLHNGSAVPYDVFTSYALTDEKEDFAETYKYYTSDTDSNLKVAIRSAAQGHSKLLDKMLFMASLMITPDLATADYDGTIDFYSPDPSQGTLSVVSKVPYRKTANEFQLDGYAFSLSGQTITGIKDPDGNVLASNIAVPLVPPYWPVARVTSPSNPNPAPVSQDPDPSSPIRSNQAEIVSGTDGSAGSIETVVGGGPDNYVPLTAASANSQLRNLQVNGIRAGDSGGAAVHGGTAVRIRPLGSSSLPSIIVDPPSSSANVIELP
jgi:hypothetical protein